MTIQLEQQLQQMETESQTAVAKGKAVLEKAQAQIDLHQAKLDKIQKWRDFTADLEKVAQDRRDLEADLSRMRARKSELQAQLSGTGEPEQITAGDVSDLTGGEQETSRVNEPVASDDHFVLNMEESSEEQSDNLELETATSPMEEVGEEVLAGKNGHLPDNPFH